MASAQYEFLSQSYSEWTTLLISTFSEPIHSYILQLYWDAVQYAKSINKANDEMFIIGIFQRYCLQIRDWSIKELNAQIALLRKNYPKLKELIDHVMETTLAVMSVHRKSLIAEIVVPDISVGVFVHAVFVDAGTNVGCKYPLLFRKTSNDPVFENYEKAQIRIQNEIKNTIRTFLKPSLLKMDEVPEGRRSPSPRRVVTPPKMANQQNTNQQNVHKQNASQHPSQTNKSIQSQSVIQPKSESKGKSQKNEEKTSTTKKSVVNERSKIESTTKQTIEKSIPNVIQSTADISKLNESKGQSVSSHKMEKSAKKTPKLVMEPIKILESNQSMMKRKDTPMPFQKTDHELPINTLITEQKQETEQELKSKKMLEQKKSAFKQKSLHLVKLTNKKSNKLERKEQQEENHQEEKKRIESIVKPIEEIKTQENERTKSQVNLIESQVNPIESEVKPIAEISMDNGIKVALHPEPPTPLQSLENNLKLEEEQKQVQEQKQEDEKQKDENEENEEEDEDSDEDEEEDDIDEDEDSEEEEEEDEDEDDDDDDDINEKDDQKENVPASSNSFFE